MMSQWIALLQEPFAQRAVLAGLLLVVMCAPLGCFVLWRRMVYIGDGMAHAGMLGIAIGVLAGVGAAVGLVLSSLVVAVLAYAGRKRFRHAQDALLGVTAHTALAAGMVVLALSPNMRVDAFGYLFGDVLSISAASLTLMLAGASAVVLAMRWQWQSLLRDAFHADLAQVEGVNTARAEIILMLSLAVTVALGIQTVGILMIVAFLIIPSAAARSISRTPEAMLIYSAVIGAVAVIAGMLISFAADVPTGPAMVLAAALQLVLLQLVGRRA
jgi:zinc transport system permease protein